MQQLKSLYYQYRLAVGCSILLHLLVIMLLSTVRFGAASKKPTVTIVPITTFIYQPPLSPSLPDVKENSDSPAREAAATIQVIQPVEPVKAKPAAEATADTAVANILLPGTASTDVAVSAAKQPTASVDERVQQTLLRQQPDLAALSYQQFLQQQRQPNQQNSQLQRGISVNPAQQVQATLDDGRQILRSKDGCRLVDPAKDGFEGMMAIRSVPCGDEITTADLLEQALQKHRKR